MRIVNTGVQKAIQRAAGPNKSNIAWEAIINSKHSVYCVGVPLQCIYWAASVKDDFIAFQPRQWLGDAEMIHTDRTSPIKWNPHTNLDDLSKHFIWFFVTRPSKHIKVVSCHPYKLGPRI